ncbi:hypothetical protein [Propionivibrio sp.]|uniref:hypothetical protein n=1 Tax=Propionivibrio sp. TaxID=2212460 RepID=UPI003BF00360
MINDFLSIGLALRVTRTILSMAATASPSSRRLPLPPAAIAAFIASVETTVGLSSQSLKGRHGLKCIFSIRAIRRFEAPTKASALSIERLAKMALLAILASLGNSRFFAFFISV